ncbi:MAG: sulfite exporter TauE/SafE family protein [Gammaproteobacteria bacterium]|nr:sulfite exporter TauE/SafE family protein [Gammaproteobacteria bacterium]
MEFLPILPLYLLIGVAAGLCAGLFGVGGGLIIVPALAYVFSYLNVTSASIMQLAVATSLAVIIITSISSVLAHHKHGAVQWPLFVRMAPFIVAGSLLGAYIAGRVPSDFLKLVFGVVEIIIALQMYFEFRPRPARVLPGIAGLGAVSAAVGFMSAIAGIGGGTMMVPFLTWGNISIHKAVATSAACGTPIAVAGSLGFMLLAPPAVDLPDMSAGFVYWPAFPGIAFASMLAAPLGARLAHRMSTYKLRRIFALFLFFIGLLMLLK